MPADDSLLAQGTVEFREEERRHRNDRNRARRDRPRETKVPSSRQDLPMRAAVRARCGQDVRA